MKRSASHSSPPSAAHRGATIVLSAFFMVAMLGMVAFGIDAGYIVLVRTQLQVAADAAAMAAAGNMGGTEADILATAKQFANLHVAGGKQISLQDKDLQFGNWDTTTRTFDPSTSVGNAIKVTCRRNSVSGGEANLFFGRIFGRDTFPAEASAVAMCNPRDICFVVDLSGSMNDDAECAWATSLINSAYAGTAPSVGTQVMQDLYDDFGFGKYPGVLEWVGKPLGVASNNNAYAEMTKDAGPLAAAAIPAKYRILASDTEPVRKQKAYSWIIDYQLAKLMPNALPKPDSAANYGYWEKYLDYLMTSVTINVAPTTGTSTGGTSTGGTTTGGTSTGGTTTGGTTTGGTSSGGTKTGTSTGGSSSGGTSGGSTTPPPPPPPPIGRLDRRTKLMELSQWSADTHSRSPRPRFLAGELVIGPTDLWPAMIFAQAATGAVGAPPNKRGAIPPNQDADRITGFNNPNKATWPAASSSPVSALRNQLGYRTYVQFMLDWGRDLKPDDKVYSPLSINSPLCPYHSEGTAGGSFAFPPRSQPTHAARRSLIAAIQVVKERNDSIPDPNQRDWVSVISFDTLANGGPEIKQPLTGDYDAAMQSCTTLQEVGDKGASTATEAGLIAANKHLNPAVKGSLGRKATNKVVVLLTDGVPNLYQSANSDINKYMTDNPSSDFYNNGAFWLDGPIMQAAVMKAMRWEVYPVGLGLGTDYNFMDRVARAGGTADINGQCPRGTGNPAQYEQRLTDIFKKIITSPQVKLVQ